MIGFEPRAIGEGQAAKRALSGIVEPNGRNCDLPIPSAFRDERIDNGLATGAGIEVSALGFVDSPVDILEVDLRPAFLHIRCGEFSEFDLGLAQHGKRAALVLIVAAAYHPENSGPVQELSLPAPFIFLPQLERTRGQFCIGLVGTVGPAHDAGFAT